MFKQKSTVLLSALTGVFLLASVAISGCNSEEKKAEETTPKMDDATEMPVKPAPTSKDSSAIPKMDSASEMPVKPAPTP